MHTTPTYRIARTVVLLALSFSCAALTAAAMPSTASSTKPPARSSRPADHRPETHSDVTRARVTRVAILMYHVIGDPRSGAPYPELFVRERDFRGQMAWLERHGYHPVTLREVWDHWRRGTTLPRRPIVITFDDGYRSIAQAAFPPMRRRDWPGVLNLTVRNLRVAGGISERQVRRLTSAGWELDAHTLTHPNLPLLDDRALDREVSGSRRELRRRFDVPIDFFCYPAGRYDARVIAAVRRAGYLGATTTLEGLATAGKPYELRRIRVSRRDGVGGFAAKLPPST